MTVKVIEDKSELNPQNLAKLEKEADAGRVVIEYNGMWLLQDLAEALPESWIVSPKEWCNAVLWQPVTALSQRLS